MSFKWIILKTVFALHKRQIAEHGGTEGNRDEALLIPALARPENLFAYGEDVDIASLSASYAFGIAKHHPFLNGDKRIAMVVAIIFLNLNGSDFDAPSVEIYIQFLGLAEGTVSEEELAKWFRERLFDIPNR